jgi:uncharacterized protein (TIGR04255 family)
MAEPTTPAAFSMEDQERVRFENNPLQTVVWQLRFPPVWAVDDPAFAARLQKVLGDEYPRADPRASQINIQVGEGVAAGPGEPAPWIFRDDTGEWVVAVQRNFLSLETTNYTRFEDFEDRLTRLLAAGEEELGLRYVSRLGLRYVDRIRHEELQSPADSTRFLNPELLGLVAGREIAPFVRDAMQQIRLALAPGQLMIRHGYLGEVDPEGPSYLIDIDAFNDEEQPYDRHACLDMTRAFKRHCWNFFRQSISDEMAAYLEPRSLDE